MSLLGYSVYQLTNLQKANSEYENQIKNITIEKNNATSQVNTLKNQVSAQQKYLTPVQNNSYTAPVQSGEQKKLVTVKTQ